MEERTEGEAFDWGLGRIRQLRWAKICKNILLKYDGPRAIDFLVPIDSRKRVISCRWARIARSILIKHHEYVPQFFNASDHSSVKPVFNWIRILRKIKLESNPLDYLIDANE